MAAILFVRITSNLGAEVLSPLWPERGPFAEAAAAR